MPESFQLDVTPPTATVDGARAKNRKTTVLPVRQGVAAELREWLPDKPTGELLFPVAGRKRKAMLRADLKAAGIEPVVDGKVIDIHALRASLITHLSRDGQGTRLNSLWFGDSVRRNADALAAAVSLAV